MFFPQLPNTNYLESWIFDAQSSHISSLEQRMNRGAHIISIMGQARDVQFNDLPFMSSA